jgi:hypothetical protein
MLGGRPAVFLSCSEKYKASVAMPVRAELSKLGVHAVIVSEEPHPPSVGWEPDDKVEYFLNGSDAMIALCTPDDQLKDGTVHTRPNIIDEIARARQKPHLRNKIQVLKAPEVRLPSNINPTYERLDPSRPAEVISVIVRQLTEWGVLAKSPAEPAAIPTDDAETLDPQAVLAGLKLGDHKDAQRRAYEAMSRLMKDAQRRFVARLADLIFAVERDDDNQPLLIACSLLEAINRLDPRMADYDLVEKMTLSPQFSTRSSAATLLWEKATAVPGDVPIDLVGRLARPATEDWYVSSPAMAATKVLVLSREDAYEILETLASSEDAEDRSAVVDALIDIARVNIVAVNRDLAERLTSDTDESIAARAWMVLKLTQSIGKEQHRRRSSPFGL